MMNPSGVTTPPNSHPRFADRTAVAVLLRAVPPALADEVIAATGALQRRERKMPARLALYFTLALWLWPDGYDVVLDKLYDAVTWAGEDVGPPPTPPPAARARARLGPEPLHLLFRKLIGSSRASGVDWRGLRVESLDSVHVSPARDSELGAPEVLALADNDGGLSAATWAPGTVSGEDLGLRLLPELASRAHSPTLVLAGDISDQMWAGVAKLGWDMATVAHGLPVGDSLGDESYLSRRRNSAVRIIPRSDGPALVTTLTDPARAPADELVRLYASRWRADDLSLRITGRQQIPLRSYTVTTAVQELWALLCVYQALVVRMLTT